MGSGGLRSGRRDRDRNRAGVGTGGQDIVGFRRVEVAQIDLDIVRTGREPVAQRAGGEGSGIGGDRIGVRSAHDAEVCIGGEVDRVGIAVRRGDARVYHRLGRHGDGRRSSQPCLGFE